MMVKKLEAFWDNDGAFRSCKAILVAGGALLAALGIKHVLANNENTETKVEISEEQMKTLIAHERSIVEKDNKQYAEWLVKYKQKSIDGTGRIVKGHNDIITIHATEPTAIQTAMPKDERLKDQIRKIVQNDYTINPSSPDFVKKYKEASFFIKIPEFDIVRKGTVAATYNIASGRICDMLVKPPEWKEKEDCFSLKDLTPGTQLAADIQKINAIMNNGYTPKAP